MYPLIVAMAGVVLLTAHLAMTVPVEVQRERHLAGDVAAANFHAYRKAAVDYYNANPTFSGAIPAGSMTFPLGYISTGAWANVVDSGTLYTYSTAVPTPEAAEAIFERGGRSMMIGKKVTGNTMTSLNGAASGFTLPATLSALPVGIVVVIGN
ncbi:MAG: type IV pilus biogenesis protein PilM [Anaerolineae bacterium]|nr:type IV pilus biogenesis protein PilM [Rhodocyclaceae bacterium]MCZ2112711.1 type IV pilus biogenesis protein PilM [Anaerolineae bacterium]